MRRVAICVVAWLALCGPLAADPPEYTLPHAVSVSVAPGATERDVTAALATLTGWRAEVAMPDETRCDLLGGGWACEVEWASKWKESIGQAVLYGIWTGERPAVLLLSRGRVDKVDVLRCRLVCERLGVRCVVVSVGDNGDERN